MTGWSGWICNFTLECPWHVTAIDSEKLTNRLVCRLCQLFLIRIQEDHIILGYQYFFELGIRTALNKPIHPLSV